MKFRLKYFLSHLFISSAIAVLSLLLIFKVWYPEPLDKALGVGGIVVMMIAIDMVLGPLLTLVLAKEGKKGLKYDLIIIATVQLSALFYGLYSIEKGRPVWLAFDLNRFELVQKYMVTRKDGENIAEAYRADTWFSPKWVSVRPAKDKKEQSDWMMAELEGGASPGMRPVLYMPIDKNMDNILKEKLPLGDLNKYNNKATIEDILSDYPQADGFLPMRASELGMTVLLDSKTRKIIAIVNLRPW